MKNNILLYRIYGIVLIAIFNITWLYILGVFLKVSNIIQFILGVNTFVLLTLSLVLTGYYGYKLFNK